MSQVTLGEALSRRRLKTYVEGKTQKYVAGQDKVSKLSDEDAIVSYVDIWGSLSIIPCELKNGEWFHRGLVIVATPTTAELRELPRNSPLGDNPRHFLERAYGKEEPPQRSDTAEGEAQPQGQES